MAGQNITNKKEKSTDPDMHRLPWSKKLVQRTISQYPTPTYQWTAPQDMRASRLWRYIRDITKSKCTKWRRPPSVHQTFFFYNVMPFDLKNIGATYQRLITVNSRKCLRISLVAIWIWLSIRRKNMITWNTSKRCSTLKRHQRKMNPSSALSELLRANF